jgi:hypothetical protein
MWDYTPARSHVVVRFPQWRHSRRRMIQPSPSVKSGLLAMVAKLYFPSVITAPVEGAGGSG